MTKQDLAAVLVALWAIITLPFFYLGYGFSSSINEFLSIIFLGILRFEDDGKIASNLAFTAPWLLIMSGLLYATARRFAKKA